MRIAINTRFLLKNKLEGIGWFTYEVAKRLVEQHPEHEFIFLFDRPFDPAFLFGKNIIPVVLFPPARHPLLWVWWFEFAVTKALRKYRAAVFLSPDGYCALRTAVPTVMVTHDVAHVHMRMQIPAKFRYYYDFFVPRYLKKAARIVTVSHFSKKDILQAFQVSPGKISVACNGVRADFQPLEESRQAMIRQQYAAGQAYFLYVGAVHPRKNVHRLIQAFDIFKKKTKTATKLLIAGRFAWQTGEVKTAYDLSDFKNDIIFLGYVPDEALPRLMGAALALVYVSLFEGFGVPLLEAMYCDVPIITSTTTSMPEIAGEAALFVNPLAVEEIASAMQVISENPALRQTLIEKGRVQRQPYNWQAATDMVYQNLLLAIEQAKR